MSLTFLSAEPARKRIALLLSQISQFDHTDDHEIKNLHGKLRTALVFSAGERHTYGGIHQQYFGFWILIIIDRAKAASAEDDIDNLTRDVRQHLHDNRVQADVWDEFYFGDGRPDGEDITEKFYPDETIFRQDGRQYKHSLFRVTVSSCQ